MAKFMEEVDGTSGLSHTNHVLRSVLSGDIESERRRLTRALEKLGYSVISEDPLYARRGARGWAAYYCSFDILDYPRKLKIGLKALSPHATLATFDYAAEHFGVVSFKGDLQTLRSEAEAIIALASQNATITLCTACGTNQPDDSRFCRVCGAPNVGGAPAELEVLRLTAGARTAHHKISAAVIWALAPFMAAIVGIIFLGAPVGRLTTGLLLAMFGNLLIWLFVLNASRRTLKPDLLQPLTLPAKVLQPGLTSVIAAPLPEQKYVTEGTTELLAPKPKEREKELVYRMGRDTSPTD
ncbi:MAG TPA: zinc ribbon domain-containing protein [Pyrinomonadaceae bacterium]|nr:zinc ribbon domain-containing protein [Pyrinomonadaceae bacterium]